MWGEEEGLTFISPQSQRAVGRPGHQLEPGCGLSTADADARQGPCPAFPASLCHLLQVGSSGGRSAPGGGDSPGGDVTEGPDSEIAGERPFHQLFHSWAAGPSVHPQPTLNLSFSLLKTTGPLANI